MRPVVINPWAFGANDPVVFSLPWAGPTTGLTVTLSRKGKADAFVTYPIVTAATGMVTFHGDDRLTELLPGRYDAIITSDGCSTCIPVDISPKCAALEYPVADCASCN